MLLRSEANRVNSSIKFSERSQLKNASVFSVGEDEGFDNNGERRLDRSVSHPTVNASRVGKDDR